MFVKMWRHFIKKIVKKERESGILILYDNLILSIKNGREPKMEKGNIIFQMPEEFNINN